MARRAEIAGAGITGLTVAILLAQRGWSVRVHERAETVREIGSGIFIKNNGVTVFEEMGVADTVFHRAIKLQRAEIYDERGVMIQRRPLQGPTRVYNLPRLDLVNGLAGVARGLGVEIACGSEAVGADPAGFLVMKDGTRLPADLVVAADGFRSQIRESLGLTEVCRELSNGSTRVLVPRNEYEGEDITREFWSGPRRIGIAPCTSDLTYSYMSCPKSDLRASAMPIDADSWEESFPMLTKSGFFRRAAADPGVTRHLYPYAHARHWTRGRVALLGDAAHALPPTLGQGAGLSIMNSRALVRMLETETDVAAALANWEKKFRWVSDETQKWARRYDTLTASWPKQLAPVRRAIIWTFGKVKFLNNRMRVADRVTIG